MKNTPLLKRPPFLFRAAVLLAGAAGGALLARAEAGAMMEVLWREGGAMAGWIHGHVTTIISAGVVVAQVAGMLSSIRAIMETRTPQGAVAWVVALNLLPYVSVPAFWVFGRNRFVGYALLRREKEGMTAQIIQAALGNMREQSLLVTPRLDDPFAVERLAHLPLTRGNDAELLVDGDATFASIFAGIDRARDYVLVQFYIIHDDATGRELLARLAARAAAGVRCCVVFDEIGSSGLTNRYVRAMRAAGIHAVKFDSRRGRWNRTQINFRNHRKIVVVDGAEAWVGGLNAGDEYRGMDKKIGYWRDTHVRVAGPVVQCVQAAFVDDWNWAAGEVLRALNWQARPAPGGASRIALCLPSGPSDELETATLFFLDAIDAARRRLWIASPYFVPDEQFISALQLAALHGVDVRILIPDKSDNALMGLSSWAFLEDLEKAGVRTFRYEKGFMHHKVMVVDDAYCTVGTANFDNRSFRLNFEVTMVFADGDFARQVAAMLEEDFKHSRLATMEELDARGFWYRLGVRAAMLLSPLQ
ncbi:MAG: cardiolipin synthase [Opitutaceae bacterium]|jgi:cardiolipin synthase|nr:cardiolipin synthase [Opitutaceae bacterium]